MRPTLKTLTAAVLLAGLSTAHAMPYSQLVIFGDSLSDSGQFPDAGSPLLFGNPTGGLRFTNRTGPGYADNNSEYYAQVSTQRLASQLGLQALPSTPILPQALTIVIPGVVNSFIALFKDTTLVSFVGLLDPLRGVTAAVRADINWKGIYWEPYIFVGAIFFVICFGMSRYSAFMERHLDTGHKR